MNKRRNTSINQRDLMDFDPDRYIRNAPSRHLVYLVGALYVIYFSDLIIAVIVIVGALWLLDQIRSKSR